MLNLSKYIVYSACASNRTGCQKQNISKRSVNFNVHILIKFIYIYIYIYMLYYLSMLNYILSLKPLWINIGPYDIIYFTNIIVYIILTNLTENAKNKIFLSGQ